MLKSGDETRHKDSVPVHIKKTPIRVEELMFFQSNFYKTGLHGDHFVHRDTVMLKQVSENCNPTAYIRCHKTFVAKLEEALDTVVMAYLWPYNTAV